MNGRNVWIIWLKELRDISRDRRALFAMVVLPIAIAPLLMLGAGKLMAFGTKRLLEDPSRIAILNEAGSPHLAQDIRAGEGGAAALAVSPQTAAARVERIAEAIRSGEVAEELAALRESGADLSKVVAFRVVPAPADEGAARLAIERKDLEAAIVIPDGFDADVAAEKQAHVTLIYDSSFDKSKVAHHKLTDLLHDYERGAVLLRLQHHGLEKALLEPIRILDSTVASKEKEGRALLAHLLPYMLILMCLAGAIYPASDVGAGEKEHGTLETLLVSPADRSEIVIAKFLVIFVTSLVAATLNIASLAFTLGGGFLPSLAAKLPPMSVDLRGGLVAFLLMLPLAATFSAILLSISIFAKSYKEAQTYFAPLNMVAILPAMFSLVPGVELDWKLSLIPIVNVSLAIKETLSGTYKWDCLGLIFASTMLLAAASVVFCSQWFKREEVLFRS